MRKLALIFMLVCAFVLAACGTSSVVATPTDTTAPAPTAAPAASPTTGGNTGAATIGMGSFNFTNTSVTIKAGQSVTFDDPSASGGTHNLVTGKNGQFSAQSGAPSEFTSSGIMFSPGDSKAIKFPTAGTYTITCTFHPSMLATVTVTA